MNELSRKFWIFDLDGTLTKAQHDFDGIRETLQLPPGRPILESLSLLPPEQAKLKHLQLDEIEKKLAADVKAAEGVHELLQKLADTQVSMAILSRNLRECVLTSLDRCKIDQFFHPQVILGRHEATPKPDPAGIHRILEYWGCDPADALMVGDYRFDLEAGRRAGVATVHVDDSQKFAFSELADFEFGSLCELQESLPAH